MCKSRIGDSFLLFLEEICNLHFRFQKERLHSGGKVLIDKVCFLRTRLFRVCRQKFGHFLLKRHRFMPQILVTSIFPVWAAALFIAAGRKVGNWGQNKNCSERQLSESYGHESINVTSAMINNSVLSSELSLSNKSTRPFSQFR